MAQAYAGPADYPKIALGVAAHPDDLDFMDAGTVAVWTSHGTEVYYLILTNGNKGSGDFSADPVALTTLRREEQRRAAHLIGVKEVFFCDYEDGLLMSSMEVKRDIVRIIRRLKPDTVITVDPSMLYNTHHGYIKINHPDHRAAGQATLDAVYPLARDHLSFPELYSQEKLAPHFVETVFLTNFERQNFYVDITDTIDLKLQAVASHDSQIEDKEHTRSILCEVAADTGKKIGVKYAEGFLRIDVQ